MIAHQIGNSQGNYNYNASICSNIKWIPHFHANYELIYAMEGQTEVVVGGESQILFEGELLLIPPYTVHEFSVGEASKSWIGVFSEDFITSFSQKRQSERFSSFTCDGQIEKMLQKYLFRW